MGWLLFAGVVAGVTYWALRLKRRGALRNDRLQRQLADQLAFLGASDIRSDISKLGPGVSGRWKRRTLRLASGHAELAGPREPEADAYDTLSLPRFEALLVGEARPPDAGGDLQLLGRGRPLLATALLQRPQLSEGWRQLLGRGAEQAELTVPEATLRIELSDPFAIPSADLLRQIPTLTQAVTQAVEADASALAELAAREGESAAGRLARSLLALGDEDATSMPREDALVELALHPAVPPTLRTECITELSSDHPRYHEALLAGLLGDDPKLAAVAAELTAPQDARSSPRPVRIVAAVAALTEGPAQDAALLRLADRRDATLARAALLRLHQEGGPDAIQRLSELSEDPERSEALRMHARRVLMALLDRHDIDSSGGLAVSQIPDEGTLTLAQSDGGELALPEEPD